MGYQYWKSYGLPIIVARAFNHEGPRRGQPFVTSNFARQISLIEAGKQTPVVFVGNLEAVRDYTDVRDIVRGYALLLEKGMPGEAYHLCSGVGWKISDVLATLVRLSFVQHIEIQVDPTRLRPSDVPILVGSAAKAKTAINWQPVIPFEKTLQDLLDYWRARV